MYCAMKLGYPIGQKMQTYLQWPVYIFAIAERLAHPISNQWRWWTPYQPFGYTFRLAPHL